MKILIQLHLLRLSQKKVVSFPENGRVKKFYYSHARIVQCVSEYIFLISKSKQVKKKKQSKARIQKKQKKLKKKRRSAENRLKK